MTITVRTFDGQTITGFRPYFQMTGVLMLTTRETPEITEHVHIGLDNIAEVIAR
jgi:hypothetical protein